jgi:hypothetical protein
MATTFTLIQSSVLSSQAASVTFSSIPQTYKDLMVYSSSRITGSGRQGVDLYANTSATSSNYATFYIEGYSTSTLYTSGSNTYRSINPYEVNPNDSTANYFSNNQTLIANYTSANPKPATHNGGTNYNSSSTFYLNLATQNIFGIGAITSLIWVPGGGLFHIGSSFHLYGISYT